jgi:hypothetical protein
MLFTQKFDDMYEREFWAMTSNEQHRRESSLVSVRLLMYAAADLALVLWSIWAFLHAWDWLVS